MRYIAILMFNAVLCVAQLPQIFNPDGACVSGHGNAFSPSPIIHGPLPNGGSVTQTQEILCTNAAGDVAFPNSVLIAGSLVEFGARAVKLKATAALTAGQVVKIDTANDSSAVVATTADTGAAVAVGIVVNSPGAGGQAFIATGGVASSVIGTGTCARGNFVIVDTTTNGRVKCTATFAAGTVIGTAITTGSGVGTAVKVLVEPM